MCQSFYFPAFFLLFFSCTYFVQHASCVLSSSSIVSSSDTGDKSSFSGSVTVTDSTSHSNSDSNALPFASGSRYIWGNHSKSIAELADKADIDPWLKAYIGQTEQEKQTCDVCMLWVQIAIFNLPSNVSPHTHANVESYTEHTMSLYYIIP